MNQLKENLRYLCDEACMLTGITAAYGTDAQSESILYGRAQEVVLAEDGTFLPRVRTLSAYSLFDLASLTKLFTSVMAMKLVELGKLSLDETAGGIDSRFTHLRDVSILDIMSFQASLQTAGRIDAAQNREEGLLRLFQTARVTPPRIRLYSDINAMVIKYIIEQKTNMAYFDALKSYVFSPLGMDNTFSEVPLDLIGQCVCYTYEHRIVKDSYILRNTPHLGQPHDPKALLLSSNGNDLCGHAGLFSTQSDMVRFAQALISGELLSPSTLSAIGKNYTGIDYGDGTHRQYLGLLCFTKHPNQILSEVPAWMAPGSFGLSGFTGNHLSIDPINKHFVLFLGNRCHNRVSNIQPPADCTLAHYGLDHHGVGRVSWPDGRQVYASARYVYFKDEKLNNPIYRRMQTLGWA